MECLKKGIFLFTNEVGYSKIQFRKRSFNVFIQFHCGKSIKAFLSALETTFRF